MSSGGVPKIAVLIGSKESETVADEKFGFTDVNQGIVWQVNAQHYMRGKTGSTTAHHGVVNNEINLRLDGGISLKELRAWKTDFIGQCEELVRRRFQKATRNTGVRPFYHHKTPLVSCRTLIEPPVAQQNPGKIPLEISANYIYFPGPYIDKTILLRNFLDIAHFYQLKYPYMLARLVTGLETAKDKQEYLSFEMDNNLIAKLCFGIPCSPKEVILSLRELVAPEGLGVSFERFSVLANRLFVGLGANFDVIASILGVPVQYAKGFCLAYHGIHLSFAQSPRILRSMHIRLLECDQFIPMGGQEMRSGILHKQDIQEKKLAEKASRQSIFNAEFQAVGKLRQALPHDDGFGFEAEHDLLNDEHFSKSFAAVKQGITAAKNGTPLPQNGAGSSSLEEDDEEYDEDALSNQSCNAMRPLRLLGNLVLNIKHGKAKTVMKTHPNENERSPSGKNIWKILEDNIKQGNSIATSTVAYRVSHVKRKFRPLSKENIELKDIKDNENTAKKQFFGDGKKNIEMSQ